MLDFIVSSMVIEAVKSGVLDDDDDDDINFRNGDFLMDYNNATIQQEELLS